MLNETHQNSSAHNVSRETLCSKQLAWRGVATLLA
jgi:hypothetical protein